MVDEYVSLTHTVSSYMPVLDCSVNKHYEMGMHFPGSLFADKCVQLSEGESDGYNWKTRPQQNMSSWQLKSHGKSVMEKS